jgi:VWFA-related protein
MEIDMSRQTSTRWWVALAMWLVAGVGMAAPSGPNPADKFSEETTTLMVEVPVEVTSDGEPLRGLKAENFEIFDNGRAQQVLGVDVIDLKEIATPEQAKSLPVAARRHFLLLFDFTFANPAALERAVTAATELVESDLHPTDLVGLATFSVRDGVKYLLNFTQDRSQVRLALGQLRASESAVMRSDPLRISVGKLINTDPLSGGGAGGRGAEARAAASNAANQLVQQIQQSQVRRGEQLGRREVKLLSDSIVGLASVMRSLQGRKHVVYFSEGFDPSLMLGTTDQSQTEANFQAAASGEIWNVDSDQVFGSRAAISAMEQMTTELKKADCVLHAVDIGGARASGAADAEGGGLGAAGRGKDSLVAMSRDTGGSLFENFNDLGAAMGKLLNRTSVTYLLTYMPSELESDGKYRKLKVKLKNVDDAKLSHRPGYFAPKPAGAADDLGSMMAASQRIFDREGGAIRTALVAAPTRQSLDGRQFVPTFLEIDGTTFLGPGKLGREQKQRRADLFVYAFDESGGVADLFTQAINLDMVKMEAGLRKSGLKLYAPLLLAPGRYTLRALVRDPASGRTGVSVDEVVVPAASGLALLPPMMPESFDAWLMVRGQRKDLEGQAEPSYPFAVGELGYVPAAALRGTAGDRLPLVVAGYELQDTALEARLVDLDGKEIALLPLTQSGNAGRQPDGLIQQLVGVTLPAVAGRYRLELSGQTPAGNTIRDSVALEMLSTVDAQVSPVVRTLAMAAPAGDAMDSGMGAGMGGMAGGAGIAPPPPEDPEAIEKALADWRAGYRAALTRLPDDEKALRSIADFEVAALGPEPAGKVARLGRAELDVARTLAKRDPEAVLPLLMAHIDLFLLHQSERRPFLELHSRQMVRQLADLYAEAGAGRGARVVAARALASLGGYLLADGRGAANDLLERAAVLDPSNEAAHLALAAYYEKRGGPYDEAASWLGKLVANRPESREGRLRLAINQLRVARSEGNVGDAQLEKTAVAHFDKLLADPAADWVTSVAAQELARYYADHKRLDQAAALLEKELKRLPADQDLMVQLTFVYDRLDRNTAGHRLAEKVSLTDSDVVVAPRGRYNQWLSEALDRDRTELQSGAKTRLKILDSALANAASQEGR